MNKNGSIGILEDHANEQQLRSLIVDFDENHNLNSKISYKDIYEFVKSAFSENKISFYPSYTWWKTTGKHLVDEYNVVKKRTIRLDEKEELDIVEIIDLVEKYCGDKETLIKYLLPYNDLVDRLVEKIDILQDTIQKLSQRLDEKDSTVTKLESRIKKQEELIDSLFYENISSELNLTDILIDEILNYSLSETFEHPSKYIKEFCKRNKINNNNSNKQKSNIIQLQMKKSDIFEEDNYDW